jgi:uncharacterized membrane protein YqhA
VEFDMKLLQNAKNNMSTAGELLGFIWKRRWWMIPLILVLLLVGVLIALASVASVFPFIYTLF